MSSTVVLDGNSFNIPDPGDQNWASGPSGLTAWLLQANTSITNRILTSGIVDNLASTSAVLPLSANQGRVLNVGKLNIADINNTLTSTSTVQPLSANMGKTLQDNKADRGGAVSAPSGNTTLVTADNRNQFMTPSANMDLVMPTTSITAGDIWQITNGSPTYVITIKASGGTTITTLIPLARVTMHSTVSTPTLNSQWEQDFADGSLTSGGFVAGSFSADYGTVTDVQCFLGRSGDRLIGQMEATMGTVLASPGRITLPFSLSIDTTSISTNRQRMVLGTYRKFLVGQSPFANAQQTGLVTADSSDATKIYLAPNTTASIFQDSNISDIFANNDIIQVDFDIPIANWKLG